MINFIIAAIFVLSPDSISEPNPDIMIYFEPPMSNKKITVSVDNDLIEGEISKDYFYLESYPVSSGNHLLKVFTSEDTLVFPFFVNEMTEKVKSINIDFFSIGGGATKNVVPDSLTFTTYKPGLFSLAEINAGFSFFNIPTTITYIKDIDYPLGWYGYGNIKYKDFELEGGYLSLNFDELTMYSPSGLGFLQDYSNRYFSLKPFYLYSVAYDTLFFEYPRVFYGGKFTLFNKISFTAFRAYDDTANFVGFPFEPPERAILLSPCFSISNDLLGIFGQLAITEGSPNIFTENKIRGRAYEAGFKLKDVKLFYRDVGENFLNLGNPYLEKRRGLHLDGDIYMSKISLSLDNEVYYLNNTLNYFLSNNLNVEFSNFGILSSFQYADEKRDSLQDISYYISVGAEIKTKVFYLSTVFSHSGDYGYFGSTTNSINTSASLFLGPFSLNVNVSLTYGSSDKYNFSNLLNYNISDNFRLQIMDTGNYSDGSLENSLKGEIFYSM